MSTCKQLEPFKGHKPRCDDYKHDLSLPIAVTTTIIKDASKQEADNHYNNYLLRERETHGRRTVLKLAWEVYARKSSKDNNMQRLRNRSLLLNLPNSEQAELVIAAVTRVVESMDGKLLVKA